MVSYDLFTGPNGEVLFLLVGEGHKNDVFMFVKTAMNYYKNYEQLLDHSLPVSPALHILPEIKGPLLFPGKVACCNIDIQDEDGAHNKAHNNNDTSVTREHRELVNNNSSEGSNNLSALQDGGSLERLAVSDTGHNRIIVFNTHGRIEVIAVHTFANICLLEKKQMCQFETAELYICNYSNSSSLCVCMHVHPCADIGNLKLSTRFGKYLLQKHDSGTSCFQILCRFNSHF
jgi:hypothetical protein